MTAVNSDDTDIVHFARGTWKVRIVESGDDLAEDDSSLPYVPSQPPFKCIQIYLRAHSMAVCHAEII